MLRKVGLASVFGALNDRDFGCELFLHFSLSVFADGYTRQRHFLHRDRGGDQWLQRSGDVQGSRAAVQFERQLQP